MENNSDGNTSEVADMLVEDSMQVKNNKERMSKKYKEMMAADKDLVNN